MNKAEAQSFVPISVWGTTSTFQEGKSFIIQGGSASGVSIGQTFSIDLSTPWDTSSVPFVRLANGLSDYNHASALTNGSQTWFVLSNGTGYQYNINVDSWTTLGGSASVSKSHGFAGTTDSNSGYIYVPNAYLTNNGTGSTQMIQYDIVNNILSGVPTQSTLATILSYSIAWSAQLKKMIVFGGAVSGTNNVNNDMYTWDSSNAWTVVTPRGTVPSPRRSACMVSAYGGAKMILYGGLTNQSNSVLSDIYILDTATMTWTKGTDAGVSSARAATACAVSNDLFISWGGGGVSTVITSNMTIIYNIKKDIWQSTYSPTPDTFSSDESDPNPSSSTNIGAIIGGVAGGVAVAALIIVFLVYRSKHNHKSEAPVSTIAQFVISPESGTGGIAAVYAPISVTGPVYYEPLQQQQPTQPTAVAMNALPYTPYQPPIIHDYIQHQQTSQIFLPQAQSLQYQVGDLQRQQSVYAPTNGTTAYSPQMDEHLYQPSDGSVTVASPTSEHKPEPSHYTSTRPLQNPQLISATSSYVDGDSSRRNPQGL
ncbi:hypothetical protein BGX21_009331 [Mortierella sp. AD011]|nr:hypothetical protein BGX20_005323 [Mortierella sp. AD010]KAF9397040.1 hypothetical protein BGX21_009331 [Mortierella sp. AD011]